MLCFAVPHLHTSSAHCNACLEPTLVLGYCVERSDAGNGSLHRIPAEHHRTLRMGPSGTLARPGPPRTTRSTRSATQKAYFGACLRACPERHRAPSPAPGPAFKSLPYFSSEWVSINVSRSSLTTHARGLVGWLIGWASSVCMELATGMLPCFQSPVAHIFLNYRRTSCGAL